MLENLICFAKICPQKLINKNNLFFSKKIPYNTFRWQWNMIRVPAGIRPVFSGLRNRVAYSVCLMYRVIININCSMFWWGLLQSLLRSHIFHIRKTSVCHPLLNIWGVLLYTFCASGELLNGASELCYSALPVTSPSSCVALYLK